MIYIHNSKISQEQLIREGDIVVCTSSGSKNLVGKSARAQKGLNVSFGAFCKVVRVNKTINSQYIGHYFNSPQYRQIISNLSGGANINNIRNEHIANLTIPLPPLDEQKRIADVLDKASELIKKRKEQIRLMDELAKSLFIEMFGDPVENPMGWEVTSLSSCVSSIENGHSPICNNIPRVDKMFGVLKLSAVTYGTYNENENKALLDGTPFNSKIEVHNADLLVTRKNTYELVGMSAYVWKTDSGLMMSDLIFRLNTSGNVNKKYLWKLINHKSFHENIKKLAGGSAGSMPNISKKRLMGLLIPLPPLLLQNEFADRIAAIEQQKALLQDGLTKMETAYKALMQEYFG